MDALKLLQTDHKNVKALFKKAEGTARRQETGLRFLVTLRFDSRGAALAIGWPTGQPIVEPEG